MINASLYWVTPDAHWIWLGRIDRYGYPIIFYEKETRLVHRLIYEEEKKVKLSRTKDLHHRCEIRLCINPEHMLYLTRAAHNKITHSKGLCVARLNANKTHCPKGHEYNTKNTYHRSNGDRVCRTCGRLRKRIGLIIKKFSSK